MYPNMMYSSVYNTSADPNMFLVSIHMIGMFLALAGGIMLVIWLMKNLKKQQLLGVIIGMIIVGLLGSFLTIQAAGQFMYAMHGKQRSTSLEDGSSQQMLRMMKTMDEKMDRVDGNMKQMMKNAK